MKNQKKYQREMKKNRLMVQLNYTFFQTRNVILQIFSEKFSGFF